MIVVWPFVMVRLDSIYIIADTSNTQTKDDMNNFLTICFQAN